MSHINWWKIWIQKILSGMANISQVRYLILSNEIVIFCKALHICQLILYLEKKIIQLKGNTPPISVLSPPPTTLTLFNSFLFQEILQYFVLYSWTDKWHYRAIK